MSLCSLLETPKHRQFRICLNTKQLVIMGQTLKEKAEEELKNNPSALGDPVSLKAETSDSNPTESEKGAQKAGKDTNASQDTKPTQLGDQVSLKAEQSDSEPTENDRGALKDTRQSKI